MKEVADRAAARRRFTVKIVLHAILGVSGLGLGERVLAAAVTAERTKEHSSGSESTELEEVVVTATRREVSVQRLPQAITAITAEQLEELNAQSFADFFRSVPGLTGQKLGRQGKFDFALRGMSSAQIDRNPSTFSVATVSQYYDEIPVTASGFQMDPRLVDIERVEVLRGPQGTFYGEGSLAGTIRFITKKPDLRTFSASVEGRGSDTQHGSGNNSESLMLNVPLIQGKAALRLNGFYSADSGYIDKANVDAAGKVTGIAERGVNHSSSRGYRGMLRVEPVERLSILVEGVHYDSRDFSLQGYQPAIGDLLLPVCPPPASTTPGGSFGGPTAPAPGGSTSPSAGSSPPPSSGSTSGPSCSQSPDTTRLATGNLYSLVLDGDLNWATLVSSSSRAITHNIITTAQLTDPPPLGTGKISSGPVLYQDTKTFTQELRLVSSKSWSDRWDYVVGAFYQESATTFFNPVLAGVVNLQRTNDLSVKQTALFVDGGYAITEHLQARLGYRATHLDNVGDVIPGTVPPPGITLPPQHTKSRYTPSTGRAVLDYVFDASSMLYTSVARGFRNGGINDTTLNAQLAVLPGYTPLPETYKPDTDVTYELGWKQTLPALRATFDTAVYHTDWKDMQVISFATTAATSGAGSLSPGIAPAYINAPKATIDGIELEGGLELLRGLQARASYAFTDAKLASDFRLNLAGGAPTLHAKKGDPVPFVPRNSGSVSLNYTQPLWSSTLRGFAIVSEQYQGRRATDFNSVLDSAAVSGLGTYFAMAAYWKASIQLGVERSNWRAAFFVDNLSNVRSDLVRYTLGTDTDKSAVVKSTDRPRTIGLTLKYTFE